MPHTPGQFTPGPWTAEIENCDSGDSVSIDAQGGYIATVLGGNEFPCLEDDEREEFDEVVKANALLIASAPDLLAQTQRDAEAFKLLGESLAVASEGIAALKQKHQRDAAVIAELLQEMEAERNAKGWIDAERHSALAAEERFRNENYRQRAVIAELVAALRAVAPEIRREHDAGDGHFSTAEVEAVERALAAESRAEAGREKA